jgi:hypothetical protein|tara:strand:+ start:1152 stop:1796 length:645 start_codon:yes stop_codon:yes gene_type:complete
MKSNNSSVQVGTSQLFLSLFLLLLAFFIFINSVSTYKEKKTTDVVESIRASFPAVVSSKQLFQLRSLKKSVVSPTVFNELDELFQHLFRDRKLKISFDNKIAQIDIPVNLIFEKATAVRLDKLETLLVRLAAIIVRAENEYPLGTEIVFGYEGTLEEKFENQLTQERCSVIMSILLEKTVPKGSVAVGLETGNPDFLRFKFRSLINDDRPRNSG